MRVLQEVLQTDDVHAKGGEMALPIIRECGMSEYWIEITWCVIVVLLNVWLFAF